MSDGASPPVVCREAWTVLSRHVPGRLLTLVTCAQVGVTAVMCAVACLGCRQNSQCRKSDPYTPGSNKKNLLGGGGRTNDYAMVAMDEGHGMSDSEEQSASALGRGNAPTERDEESPIVARVLSADYGDEKNGDSTKKHHREDAPEISTDFLAQDGSDGNVDDWLQTDPPKKEKIKIDYSSYD